MWTDKYKSGVQNSIIVVHVIKATFFIIIRGNNIWCRNISQYKKCNNMYRG